MRILIIFSTLCCLAMAAPKYLTPVVSYGYFRLPLAYDGSVLDTPEVAQAKAAHLATQAYEAARNTLGYVPALAHVYAPAITYAAPTAADGNVVDTPEVAEAKAAHLAAHALESAKRLGYYPYGSLAYASLAYADGFGYGAPIGPDGRVVDTPEVSRARAEHLAAHAEAAAKSKQRHD